MLNEFALQNEAITGGVGPAVGLTGFCVAVSGRRKLELLINVPTIEPLMSAYSIRSSGLWGDIA
jgi:hypothetical protein